MDEEKLSLSKRELLKYHEPLLILVFDRNLSAEITLLRRGRDIIMLLVLVLRTVFLSVYNLSILDLVPEELS